MLEWYRKSKFSEATNLLNFNFSLEKQNQKPLFKILSTGLKRDFLFFFFEAVSCYVF